MYGHMANYTTKVIQKTRPRPLVHRPHKALSEIRAWNKAKWLQYIRTILSQDIPQSYHLWTPCLHQELAYTPKNPHRRANMTKWIWEKNIIIFIELSIKPFQNPPLWHLFVLLKYTYICYESCGKMLWHVIFYIYFSNVGLPHQSSSLMQCYAHYNEGEPPVHKAGKSRSQARAHSCHHATRGWCSWTQMAQTST